MFTLSTIGSALSGFFCVQIAFGAPIPHKPTSTTSSASTHTSTSSSDSPTSTSPSDSTSGSGGISSAPYYVVYSDEASTAAPDPKDIQFWQGKRLAGEWEKLSDSKRQSTLQQYEQAGIKIMVSAFGAEDAPTTQGSDPTTLANTLAEWVIKYGVHGIDVDYEDFDAIGDGSGPGAEWVITFTKALRQKLPQGQYMLTHAPVAPWFTKNDGPYLKVHQEVGGLIDWYNVQFYNQGKTVYNTCENLVTKMNDDNPPLLEIVANGVPIEKLVVGKPAVADDASDGYISPTELGECLTQAKQQNGYNSGAMTWEYHTDGSTLAWIKGVLGSDSSSSSADKEGPTTSERRLAQRKPVNRLSY
ncbi:glycoside hydrolase superfamily [Rhodocollybia butyracea]|uniref:Glycoside hydrolase superfamily n=1 Tax=Rhodocollybia butyracea TaxID=206335 RepID=A0A9P5QB53_9AGAR|nr:glycoside hydrolase superfamily [Rhodocollybia butyracea]